MEIRVIAVRHKGDADPWIVEAWDEWSIDGNSEGFEEAVRKCEKEHGTNSEVRVGIIEVPDGFLQDMFDPHKTTGKVVDE